MENHLSQPMLTENFRAVSSDEEIYPSEFSESQQKERAMWKPGTPVITEQDNAEWSVWKRQRKSQLQRERRASMVRIDYYPSDEVAAAIERLRTNHVGGDASSIINRIVVEWLSLQSLDSGVE